jgi:hypothetical protein
MTNLGIVRLLKNEHDRLTKQIQGLSAALSAFGAVYGKGNVSVNKKSGRSKGKSGISAKGRAAIAEAQRQRWGKPRRKTGQTKSAAAPNRRTMSAEARSRIAAAQRARWAKVEASRKKAA